MRSSPVQVEEGLRGELEGQMNAIVGSLIGLRR